MLHSAFSAFERDPFFHFDREFSSGLDSLERQFDLSHRFSNQLVLDSRAIGGNNNRNSKKRERDANMSISPFSSFDIFSDMHRRMLHDVNKSMEKMMECAQDDANCYTYESSSFYTYDALLNENGRKSEPRIYEAHHSLKRAGDIKEERKGMRDSRLAEERMHVGRYIGDRGEIQERRLNLRTGDREDHKELICLETDEDAARFQENWRERTRRFSSVDHRARRIPDPSSRHYGQLGNSNKGSPSKDKDKLPSKGLKPVGYADTRKARK